MGELGRRGWRDIAGTSQMTRTECHSASETPSNEKSSLLFEGTNSMQRYYNFLFIKIFDILLNNLFYIN